MILVWSLISAVVGVYITAIVTSIVSGVTPFIAFPGFLVFVGWLYAAYRFNQEMTIAKREEHNASEN